jgi:hypothetical protein
MNGKLGVNLEKSLAIYQPIRIEHTKKSGKVGEIGLVLELLQLSIENTGHLKKQENSFIR